MAARRPSSAALLAGSGILLLGAITLLATRELLGDLARVARRVASGDADLAGMALPAMGLLAAAVLSGLAILAAARWSVQGPRGERRALLLGMVVLVGIRIVVAVAYDGVGDGEPREYDALARGVLDGACCFADRPMGYPVVLAGAYALLGASPLAVEALNVALALVAGLAVLAIARGLYGPRVGALALLAYGLWPAGALMVTSRQPHVAFDALVAVAALAAVGTPPGWRGSALTGAVLALGQYLRPMTPALLGAFLLARLWPARPWRRALAGASLPLLATFGLLLLPVVEHNLRIHGEPSVSTSAFGGHSLYIGTDARSGGRWSQAAQAELDALDAGDQWTRSQLAGELGMRRVRADPLGILELAVRKQVVLWGSERYGVAYGIRRELAEKPEQPAGLLPSLASASFWVVVSGLATLGVHLRRTRPDALVALLVSTIASVALAHALLEVRDRYHSYVVPLMLPLAAVGLVAILTQLGLVGSDGHGADLAPDETGAPSGPADLPSAERERGASEVGHTAPT